MRAMRRWRALGGENTILLELGSGAKKGENGWITVDIGGADINYDLRRGIPLRDCCVDGIYTSHMLEHIPYKELIEFISECKRVLKNGGYLSVCVPNAALYIEGYISKTNPLSESHTFYQPAVVETGSFLDQVNYIAYMDGHHHYLFDKENLVNTLKMGGFEKVVLRDFDSSLDLESRHFGSIYAIAYRQFEQR
jgi:predicted SAM-dependent methyltransferase